MTRTIAMILLGFLISACDGKPVPEGWGRECGDEAPCPEGLVCRSSACEVPCQEYEDCTVYEDSCGCNMDDVCEMYCK